MELGVAFPWDGESSELVDQGEGLLDDIPEFAHILDVRGAFAGDDGQDAAFVQFIAVGVGVVSPVSEQGLGTSAGPARTACHRWDAVDRCEGLGTSLTFAAVVMR
ncbi:hypothetical protein OG365_39545 (plasmid) [Streptomyces sp. NBC_00853]|uniref:hypothetical protein n=1 Tax=Streptomyces sp. NBC_00853 TaxID=2903681 RepID=UPI0038733FE5|nr:hypothetical protein OG365_39545 [Streptomyces sp. NBC_00853]